MAVMIGNVGDRPRKQLLAVAYAAVRFEHTERLQEAVTRPPAKKQIHRICEVRRLSLVEMQISDSQKNPRFTFNRTVTEQ